MCGDGSPQTPHKKKGAGPRMVNQGHLMIIIENVGMISLVKIKISLINLQQEQRDLDASYQQSKLNKKERS